VQSIYRWRGAIEDSVEVLMIIKSSRGLFDRLQAVLAQRHSYDVPELIALPVVDGSPNYLYWMETELARTDRE
jgi:periplasmic divalent cation tolerance protein